MTMSIDQAKKTVENVQSWEEALLYATTRIKDLQFSVRVFKKMIEDGVPWTNSQGSTDATRN